MKRVIARLNGGLGNQMFQYAFARNLASHHGAELVLDKSLYGLDYIPESYRLDEFDIKVKFTGKGQNWLNRLLLSPKLPHPLRNGVSSILHIQVLRDDASFSARGKQALLAGYFQRPSAFAQDVELLRKVFTLPIESDLANQYLELIKASNSVALHIRRGDYADVPEFRENIGLLDKDYFLSCVSALKEQVTDPKFFIFSNDRDWVAQNILQKVPTATVVDLGPSPKDVEELALMRQCKHFIVANSTFSWWPAFLGEYEHKVVLAPFPWFRADQDALNPLLLDDWQMVEAAWDTNALSSDDAMCDE